MRGRRAVAAIGLHFIVLGAEGRVVDTWEGRGDAGILEAMLAELP